MLAARVFIGYYDLSKVRQVARDEHLLSKNMVLVFLKELTIKSDVLLSLKKTLTSYIVRCSRA